MEAFDIILETWIDRNNLINMIRESESLQEQYFENDRISVYDTNMRKEYYIRMTKGNWLVIVGENIEESKLFEMLDDKYGIQDNVPIDNKEEVVGDVYYTFLN